MNLVAGHVHCPSAIVAISPFSMLKLPNAPFLHLCEENLPASPTIRAAAALAVADLVNTLLNTWRNIIQNNFLH